MDTFEKNLISLYRKEALLGEEKSLSGYRRDPFIDFPEDIRKLSLGLFHPLHHGAADYAKGLVLDIGCGSGFDLYYLNARNKGLKLCGADLSQELLDRGKKVLGSHNFSPMLVRSNARKLPFRSSCAQLVLAHAMIHLSAARQEIISEAFRVLCDKGSLLICEPVVTGEIPGFLRQEYERTGGVFLYGGLDSVDSYRLYGQKAGFSYFDLIELRDFDPVSEIKEMIRNKYGSNVPDMDLSGLQFSILTAALEKGQPWGRRQVFCSECGVHGIAPYCSVINELSDPKLASLVREKKLNFYICTSCGNVVDCPEPFLFVSRSVVINKLPHDYREREIDLAPELRRTVTSIRVETVYSWNEFQKAVRPWWKFW